MGGPWAKKRLWLRHALRSWLRRINSRNTTRSGHWNTTRSGHWNATRGGHWNTLWYSSKLGNRYGLWLRERFSLVSDIDPGDILSYEKETGILTSAGMCSSFSIGNNSSSLKGVFVDLYKDVASPKVPCSRQLHNPRSGTRAAWSLPDDTCWAQWRKDCAFTAGRANIVHSPVQPSPLPQCLVEGLTLIQPFGWVPTPLFWNLSFWSKLWNYTQDILIFFQHWSTPDLLVMLWIKPSLNVYGSRFSSFLVP